MRPLFLAIVALAGLASACLVDVDLGRPGFPCNADASCEEGLVCVAGRCLAPGSGQDGGGPGEGDAGPQDGGLDAGPEADGGLDAGLPDGGADGGFDGGADAGVGCDGPCPPGAIRDLGARGASLERIDLTWTQVDDGTGLPAAYEVRMGAPGEAWEEQTAPASGTCAERLLGDGIGEPATCSVEGLEPDTAYAFRAVALRSPDLVDLFGPPSEPVVVSTDALAGCDPGIAARLHPVYPASEPLVIDGRGSEYASALELEVRGAAAVATFRLVWDALGLYLHAQVVDSNLAAPYQGRDASLWLADSVQILLDPLVTRSVRFDADDRDLIVSVASDLYDSAGGDNTVNLEVAWAVVLAGTLNDGPNDQGYQVELALPWTVLLPEAAAVAGGLCLGANLALHDSTGGAIDHADWAGLTTLDAPYRWNLLELHDGR